MDTTREYTDGSQAAGTTESNLHKDAYRAEEYSATKLPFTDTAQANQLEQNGLLPTVTVVKEQQTISGGDAAAPQAGRSDIPNETRARIRTLSNAENGSMGYSAQVDRALRGMIDRNGIDGFDRLIGVLDSLTNGNPGFYRHELRNNSGVQVENPTIANRLANLERLCDPAAAQAVIDLNKTMRNEGYTQNLSLDDLSPESIRMLSTQPEERRAFIEFNNEARHSMGPAFFLQAVPEMLDAQPSDQLRFYRIWLRERTDQATGTATELRSPKK